MIGHLGLVRQYAFPGGLPLSGLLGLVNSEWNSKVMLCTMINEPNKSKLQCTPRSRVIDTKVLLDLLTWTLEDLLLVLPLLAPLDPRWAFLFFFFFLSFCFIKDGSQYVNRGS